MAELQILSNAGEAARTALHVRTGGMAETLRNLALQRRIYFLVKKLKKSQVPEQTLSPSCRLMVPAEFTRNHSDKFHDPLTVRNGTSSRPCRVRLIHVWNHAKVLQLKLGRGWRGFATYNELVVGDALIFELTAMSEFKVHIFRGNEKANAEVSSFHDPKKRCFGSGLSQENGNNASGRAACSSHQQLAADRSSGSADGFRVWIEKRAIGQPQAVVFPSPTTLQNPSSINVLQASRTEIVQIISSPERRSGSHGSQEPQAVDHQQLNVPEIPTRRDEICAQVTDARMTQDKEVQPHQANAIQPPQANVSLPSFTQRLVLYNVQDTVGNTCGAFLEVPYSFVTTHGKQLQAAHVHLQGIRGNSPVRPVAAYYHSVQKAGEQTTRRLLRLGWGDFVKENALRAGQELVFTLAADSCFKVGEVPEIIVL